MTRVRLELNNIEILRPKKRWKLYFIIVAEHPDDPEKMVITTIPDSPIRLVPEQDNEINFGGEGDTEGLLLLRREMPETRELNVHCYIRHSRKSTHTIGEVLSNIESELGDGAMGVIGNILGTTNPWLVIARAALPLVGKILQKIPDRDMGFISMFERFGPEFELEEEIDFERKGGFSSVVYTWSVDS